MTLKIQVVSDDPDADDEQAMIHWLNHQLSPLERDMVFADIITFIGGLLQKRAARVEGRMEVRYSRKQGPGRSWKTDRTAKDSKL